MKKIVFLDRDGTISKEYSDNEWRNITTPILLNGTIEGLKTIVEDGYEIIILTNQNLISDGIITEKQFKNYNDKLIKILSQHGISILKTYYCPHNDKDNCNCKKPKTGMIDAALKDYNIDIKNSFYIGDSYSDYNLAKKFNMNFYGIKGKNNNDIFKYDNIYEIIKGVDPNE